MPTVDPSSVTGASEYLENEQLRREDTGRLLVINEATGERAELPLAVG